MSSFSGLGMLGRAVATRHAADARSSHSLPRPHECWCAREHRLNLRWRKLLEGESLPGRSSVKKEDETHMQIVSADISSESLTGMVIFRPHCMSRAGRKVDEAGKSGNWYALRPAEVRSFARALLDAADTLDLKTKTLQAAKTATG
ncbi:hypothetical protein [Rhodanobacter sp. OR444]|uniref:hypothetical protein n=2 Tax=Rhodanobacteraceae TaxID=1775411 RepID=UPI0021016716|nr:hypothetical protein [Rhodanobacter sp. OR444]